MEIKTTFSKGGKKGEFGYIPDVSMTRGPTSDDTFCGKNYLEKETLAMALKLRAQPVCG
jgi:hypothetical protein